MLNDPDLAQPMDTFLEFAESSGALRFGSFITKSGRPSPYFFNTGDFDSGTALSRLGDAYAEALMSSGLQFDMLFGPAYKGITLSAATAIGLSRHGRDVPFCYNRKEAKDHGEGGLLVGAPLVGRVVIVDDVITDGAAKRESVQIIRSAGADPVAVLIALDRGERVTDQPDSPSAVQAFQDTVGVPVVTIATVVDVMGYLARKGESRFTDFHAIADHLERYRAIRNPAGEG